MSEKIVGVSLLLCACVDHVPMFYVIEEGEEKPEFGKEQGMFSFPLKMKEPTDTNLAMILSRLMKEEMGIEESEVMLLGTHYDGFRPIPGKPEIETYYAYGIFRGDIDRVCVPDDEHVPFVGWMELRTLLMKKLRREVAPILDHFINTRAYAQTRVALYLHAARVAHA